MATSAIVRAFSPVLLEAIDLVISVSPKEKMIGPDARGVIANMADKKTRRDFSEMNDPRGAMRTYVPIAKLDASIPIVAVIATYPKPTTVASFHVAPKSFGKRADRFGMRLVTLLPAKPPCRMAGWGERFAAFNTCAHMGGILTPPCEKL